MTAPTVSVIIVSRGRPDGLRLCLTALDQVSYPKFEVIVVADEASRSGLGDWPARIKLVPFETANISAARNAGIAMAAGDVVAFIDDDAVPVATWLTYLTAPFASPDVSAAGGYVIGRNGITHQWKARMAFPDGAATPLPIKGNAVVVHKGEPGRAIKTEGTNMAVRRSVLVELGGFDEAFAFYLDETDLDMRLAAARRQTAIVPLAEVHHGYAASARRTKDRVPRDLEQIAASVAVFQRKHGSTPTPVAERRAHRARLLRLMRAGQMMPGDVRKLLRGFDRGWAEGMVRAYGAAVSFDDPPALKVLHDLPRVREHEVIHARFWQRKQAVERACQKVAEGAVVSVYLFSFTALFHRCGFMPGGYWLQSGGQFGKSLRTDPLFRLWRAKSRLTREKDRVAVTRLPKMPPIP